MDLFTPEGQGFTDLKLCSGENSDIKLCTFRHKVLHIPVEMVQLKESQSQYQSTASSSSSASMDSTQSILTKGQIMERVLGYRAGHAKGIGPLLKALPHIDIPPPPTPPPGFDEPTPPPEP
ncbi:hypothetical protein PanWU01x14_359220, partial [Parasponia andersonii]